MILEVPCHEQFILCMFGSGMTGTNSRACCHSILSRYAKLFVYDNFYSRLPIYGVLIFLYCVYGLLTTLKCFIEGPVRLSRGKNDY